MFYCIHDLWRHISAVLPAWDSKNPDLNYFITHRLLPYNQFLFSTKFFAVGTVGRRLPAKKTFSPCHAKDHRGRTLTLGVWFTRPWPWIAPRILPWLADPRQNTAGFLGKFIPWFLIDIHAFVMMLQGWVMVWLTIQLALGKASSIVWLLLCLSPGWWWSKLFGNLV